MYAKIDAFYFQIGSLTVNGLKLFLPMEPACVNRPFDRIFYFICKFT